MIVLRRTYHPVASLYDSIPGNIHPMQFFGRFRYYWGMGYRSDGNDYRQNSWRAYYDPQYNLSPTGAIYRDQMHLPHRTTECFSMNPNAEGTGYFASNWSYTTADLASSNEQSWIGWVEPSTIDTIAYHNIYDYAYSSVYGRLGWFGEGNANAGRMWVYVVSTTGSNLVNQYTTGRVLYPGRPQLVAFCFSGQNVQNKAELSVNGQVVQRWTVAAGQQGPGGLYRNYLMVGGTYPDYSNKVVGKIGPCAAYTRFLNISEIQAYYEWCTSLDARRSRYASAIAEPILPYVAGSHLPKLTMDLTGQTGLVVADLSQAPDKYTMQNVRKLRAAD